jgi:FlaA1/EpsC-like NDP-sugar epimerase
MSEMLKRIILKHSNRFVSKWVVLFIDTALVAFSVFMAYLLRFNFELSPARQQELGYHMVMVTLFFLISFLLFRTYKGIIRHTSMHEVSMVFLSVFSASMGTLIFCKTKALCGLSFYPQIPLSILGIIFLASLFFMITFRLGVKLFFLKVSGSRKGSVNVMIYGAGELGRITKQTLDASTNSGVRVVAFMDDNTSMDQKRLEGVRVYRRKTALTPEFIEKHNIAEVIIAIRELCPARKQKVVDACLALDVVVKSIPPVDHWINGSFSARQIQKVKIEDLLHRPSIELKNLALFNEIGGKTVMVTGAAGSIGSGLAKLLVRLHPARLVMVDVAETPMFELENYFKEHQPGKATTLHYHIADISNKGSMCHLFETYTPDFVYHAAAYKHVPMMEANPQEAIRVNVLGTRVLARLASSHGVDKFVFISTDKAVNPTSVMGASKRAAEIFVQSLNGQPGVDTRFITTRFGNVLGSNGSVIPIFEKQIAAGGPVKVTHPDITRYFMTIPEACNLVLEAGAMGQGGEIFLFDMGTPVRIVDVARKMIKLSGLEPDKDIAIEITGLRPGEKLFEELLADQEKTLPTHHPKIMIARVRSYAFEEVRQAFELMGSTLSQNQPEELVAQLKELIPEYVSNNSQYQALDAKRAMVAGN